MSERRAQDLPALPPGDRVGRRSFIGALIAGFMALGAFLWGRRPARVVGSALRPPGAVSEGAFLDACTRCFKCVNVCPNGCIKVHGLSAGIHRMFTPYIKARERACTLCGECARVCPTGALQAFEPTRDGWLAGVAMGTARVNKAMCYSFHGRTCGACYRACPLAGTAMKIGVFETPLVQPESCVGCGLCEQACLHLPQAIRVIPTSSARVHT
ncbi:4Fe-4S dicluster domain-containing protein [Haliangium sp.]|uniref:4Fe-4S dicluster domain-containing protein n=1 Tax=Haliangium sp. TaxID=2663208 RepID=UPI003D0E694F